MRRRLIWRGASKVFGDKLEWRVSDSKPIAGILRAWRVDTDTTMLRKSFLWSHCEGSALTR